MNTPCGTLARDDPNLDNSSAALFFIPDHMRVFDAIELVFQLSDFLAVSIHLLASHVPIFIKLVYD
jgi:hypothetical protein